MGEITEKHYVYVLLSLKDKRFYIGYTKDVLLRLGRHSRGEVKSTKNRRPLVLVHYECFIDKRDAEAREVFLKSGFGREQLRKSIRNTLDEYGVE